MKWNNFFIIHTSRPHSDINTLHACSFFNLPLTFSSSQSCIQYYNIKMKLEPPLFKIEFPYHVIFVTSTVCIDKWSLGTMWFFSLLLHFLHLLLRWFMWIFLDVEKYITRTYWCLTMEMMYVLVAVFVKVQ